MRRGLQGVLLVVYLVLAAGAEGLLDALGPAGFAVAGGVILAALGWTTLPRAKKRSPGGVSTPPGQASG